LRVGAFAVLLSIGTGSLFGLVPALRISRHGAEVRRVSSRTVSSDRSVRRLRAGLVAAECALAVVLLTGAGLLIRSLLAVRGVDPGFGDRAALTAHLRFHTSLSRARRVALYGEAHDRIAALPGVRASGGIGTLFWDSEAAKFGLRAVDGQPAEAREQWTALSWTTISGDYFRAAGIPLLRGRHFTSQDRRDAAPVAIVNQTMARRFWPGEDPIGKRFKGFDPRGRDDEWVTVVGVVADVRSRGLEQSPMAQIFEPQTQSLDETENLVVSAAASRGLSEAIRASIAAFDRTAVVSDFSTLGGLLDEQSSQRRFETYVLSGFATLALVLAAAGIFTLVHYSVSQRTREIGIRLALGARSGDVTAMIVGDGMRTAALGIIIGLAGSLALTRVLSSVLFGVTALDPVTFLTVTALLLLLALSACWAPASRAARANPVVALRPE
jgi:predicted permease